MNNIKFCPFCSEEGTVKLKKERKIRIANNVNETKPRFMDWFIYQCSKCGEKFTTTESDSQSLIKYNEKFNIG